MRKLRKDWRPASTTATPCSWADGSRRKNKEKGWNWNFLFATNAGWESSRARRRALRGNELTKLVRLKNPIFCQVENVCLFCQFWKIWTLDERSSRSPHDLKVPSSIPASIDTFSWKYAILLFGLLPPLSLTGLWLLISWTSEIPLIKDISEKLFFQFDVDPTIPPPPPSPSPGPRRRRLSVLSQTFPILTST